MSKPKKLVVWFAAGGIMFAAWSMMSSERDQEEMFANHLWVDRMPEHDRDMVRYFVAIHSDGHRVGAAGKASAWRQVSDFFLWTREDDRLSLYFGQDRVRWKPRVKVWRCESDAPAGFELCLKIWDERHTVLLYSRDDWKLDPDNPNAGENLPAFVPALPALQSDADADADGWPLTDEPRLLSW